MARVWPHHPCVSHTHTRAFLPVWSLTHARTHAAPPFAQVAARTGIPVERQRYWTMKRRANFSHRPERPLTAQEEASQLVDLSGIRELAREGTG